MRTLNFDKLSLNTETTDALKRQHINELTSLQQTILSSITNSQSLVAEAEPGKEKNTGLAAATVEILNRKKEKGTRVLILTNEASTAQSICQLINEFDEDDEICVCLDDKNDAAEETIDLEAEPPVVVALPSKLRTLIKERRFIFRNVEWLVLDELDALLVHDQRSNLKRIKRRVLSDYTSCVCTKNLDKKVKQTALTFAKDPVIVGFDTGPNGAPPPIAGHLQQGYINVPYRMKISTLVAHLKQSPDDICIIFTASKRGTDRLYRALKKQGMKATSLHGKLSEQKYQQRFANFADGNVKYLLVADISAAELTLDSSNHIVNYDVPKSSDEYRFRAGLIKEKESARIVSLVSQQDQSDISELQNELGQTPDEIPLPDQVKQKVEQRKNKKSNGRNKNRDSNKKNDRSKNKTDDMHLPEPSYDKLSGGRNGDHDEKKTGIVKFFKKLFS